MKTSSFENTLAFFALFLLGSTILPYWGNWAYCAEKTELLFVGEDLSVVTIASRRAESVESAPAVASVTKEKRFERLGLETLGEALSIEPGFFTTKREWGTQPFLRGVQEGILFLYDSVPLTSDATKSIHPLDQDLSLFFVKRLEIIRGPGSVLWGPDAFAGIVNVVPKQGRDVNGLEIQTKVQAPLGKRQVDILWGKNQGLWEGLLGMSASRVTPRINTYNVVRFQDEGTSGPIPPSERLGQRGLDDSQNLELYLNFSWRDWLRISGRWSEMEKNYVLTHKREQLSWKGQRKNPFRFLKMELRRPIGSSTLRLNAYVNELAFRQEEIDFSWEQTSRIYYAETLIEREFSGTKGLFTIGASYRRNRVTGAVVSKSFIPDFIQPENELFVPLISQEDFDTDLKSIFFQVRRHWTKWDLWAGIRMDDHSQYDLTWSHNLGTSYHPGSSFYAKLLYGTAFRTPYNQQLLGTNGLDPESVKNVSLNLHWTPQLTLSSPPGALVGDLTLYWNQLKDHVKEDPFAGLSRPGDGEIFGIELGIKAQPSRVVRLWANTTFQHYTGDKDRFRFLDFVLIKPDGTEIPHFSQWESPFEKGPDVLANLGVELRPWDGVTFSTIFRYSGPWWVTFNKGQDLTKIPWRFTVDTTLRATEILPHVDAYVTLKNLLDERDQIPGTYSTYESQGISAIFGLEARF